MASKDAFSLGYFCAVAVALREDGPSTLVRSMFAQGGDPTEADPMDIALFVEHGLMPAAVSQPPAADSQHKGAA